jgi:hypothetical protein
VKRREFLALMLLTLGASVQVLDLDRLVTMLTSGRIDKPALDDLRAITRGYAQRAESYSVARYLAREANDQELGAAHVQRNEIEQACTTLGETLGLAVTGGHSKLVSRQGSS